MAHGTPVKEPLLNYLSHMENKVVYLSHLETAAQGARRQAILNQMNQWVKDGRAVVKENALAWLWLGYGEENPTESKLATMWELLTEKNGMILALGDDGKVYEVIPLVKG